MTTEQLDAPLGAALAIADPADRLVALRDVELDLSTLAGEARAARIRTIGELRDSGLTWRVIGELLGGISAQSAEQLGRPSPTQTTTPGRDQA